MSANGVRSGTTLRHCNSRCTDAACNSWSAEMIGGGRTISHNGKKALNHKTTFPDRPIYLKDNKERIDNCIMSMLKTRSLFLQTKFIRNSDPRAYIRVVL